MTGPTLRGAMIGAGTWSDNQLSAWQAVTNAEIVALCDRDHSRLHASASKFGIQQTYTDASAMLAAATLDFVDLCVRPASHAGLVRLVADHGLNVLCQKPFCTSLDEAAETIAYCAAKNCRLMINENFRWQAWYRQIKQLLDDGAVGEPFHAALHKRQSLTHPRFEHDQTYFAEMPRLIVYEMGIHYLDTFRFLFGDPESIYARLHKVSNDIVGEDVEIMLLAYPDMTAVIQHSWASLPVPGLDYPDVDDAPPKPAPLFGIDGTDGTISLQPDGTLTLRTHTGIFEQFTFDDTVRAVSRQATQQHFIDCLHNNTPFETDGPQTLKTLQLVYAAYESAASGQVVMLS